MSAVEFRGVSKAFGGKPALRDFSAAFGPGLNLLVGPNGSGKSTLLNLAAGIVAPDAGEIRVMGQGAGSMAAKARSFLAPAYPPPIPWLTGRLFIEFAASLYATRQPDEAIARSIERLALAGFVDKPMGAMSGGMARKVLIAAAFASGAPVLLLDEPTNELDEAAARAFREMLAENAARTVILATHHAGMLADLAAGTTVLAREELSAT